MTDQPDAEKKPDADKTKVEAPKAEDMPTDTDGVMIIPGKDDGAPGLKRKAIDALRKVFDPEIPVNIYDMGMIYNLNVDAQNNVHFVMTLTSPACPVAGTLPPDAERKVGEVEGVTSSKHELVWDPPWNPEMMHESAKLELGWYEDI